MPDRCECGSIDGIERYAGRPEELIQALQFVQSRVGFVSEEMQARIADLLGISIARVHGVVTFYHLFRTQPAGRHTISLCLGTACHVLGADKVLVALQDQLGVSVGETTADDLFTLGVVRCLGTCSLAPVMMVDEDVYGRLTPASVVDIVSSYREGGDRDARP